jgi:hypothetical protein
MVRTVGAIGKRVGKAILPRPVLRLINAYRYDNDQMWKTFASKRMARRLEAGVLHSRTTRPFAGIPRSSFSQVVLTSLLEPWRDWGQRERIGVFKGSAFIEPAGGWIICGPRHLASNCLIDPSSASKPSFRDYLETRLWAKREVREERRLIHLRDWGESNYWHFLNDLVGGRLRLADEIGVGADVPLLIGRRAFAQPFVQDILRSTQIGRRRLLVQGDEMFHCREVIHFETPRHSTESIDFVLRCLGVRGGEGRGNKRLFLSRSRGARRTIGNLPEIEEVCRRRGFEVVETEHMSLAEQIDLFSQVRYLVAIHGAGLANVMFRRGARLDLLEIFPSTTYLGRSGRVFPPPAHYFWLAQACGFRYEALFGMARGEGDFESVFHVDPTALDVKIEEMLM